MQATPKGLASVAPGVKPQQGLRLGRWITYGSSFFVTIWIIPVLFVFVYSNWPVMVLLATVTMFACALYPLSGHRGQFLASTNTTCCIVSLVAGVHCYYTHVYPMHSLMEGRDYKDVFAGETGQAFSDGAVIRFDQNTRVDTNKGIGMKSLGADIRTFCVAPIVEDTFIGRADFWAVGIGCCGERGSFECDDVGVASARTGFQLRDPEYNDPLYGIVGKYVAQDIMRRDLFLDAIQMAQVAHGVTAGGEPLLVRWINRSREEVIQEEWRAIVWTIGLQCAFALLGATILTKLSLDYGDVQSYAYALEMRIARQYNEVAKTPIAVAVFVEANAPNVPVTPKYVKELMVTRCLVPYVVLMSCMIIWSFLYTFYIGRILMIAFVVVIGIQIFGLLVTQDRYVYGLFILLITCIGIKVGEYNFTENTFRYFAVANHRAYSNVLPDADAEQYRDAGKLIFAEGTGVRTTMSIGFKVGPATYCASPIMRENVTHPPLVDFWAVGTNCCDPRGGFRCDGALNKSSRGGVVFHDIDHEDSASEIHDDLHLGYLKAVKAASSAHGLTTSADPLLLRFGPDLKELQWQWMNKATGLVVMSAIVSLQILLCSTCITGLHGRWLYKRRKVQFQQDLKREHQSQQQIPAGQNV